MLIWILIFSEKKLDLLAYQNTETNNISDKQKGQSQKWSDQSTSHQLTPETFSQNWVFDKDLIRLDKSAWILENL